MSENTEKPTTDGAVQAPKVEYILMSDGVISRKETGKPTIAVAKLNLETKVVEIVQGAGRYRSTLTRWLNDQGIEYAQIINEGDKPDNMEAAIPPPPPMHPMMGDKTPAYVEWVRKYRPAEYRSRYGIIRSAGGVEVATRKTHRTQLAMAGGGTAETGPMESNSWDADTSVPEQEG